jgi:hypothetical protein
LQFSTKLTFKNKRGIDKIEKKIKEEEEKGEVEVEVGYSIIIDRRNDKWSSVKHVLLLIQVNIIYS